MEDGQTTRCGGSVVAAALTSLLCAIPIASAQLAVPPADPRPDAKYVFYLHGASVEENPEKAQENWRANARALGDKGFIVIAEQRSPNTNVRDYAKKISDLTRALVAKGVPPSNVTVVGFSKGGMITLSVANWNQEPRMNYVILAGCAGERRAELQKEQRTAAARLKGRMLSIYDAADPEFGTCQLLFDAAGGGVKGTERRVESGRGHQAFASVDRSWLDPVVGFIESAK